ncbi:acylphosphatase, partial [Xanthomonas oryzae pv. oryzae]
AATVEAVTRTPCAVPPTEDFVTG